MWTQVSGCICEWLLCPWFCATEADVVFSLYLGMMGHSRWLSCHHLSHIFVWPLVEHHPLLIPASEKLLFSTREGGREWQSSGSASLLSPLCMPSSWLRDQKWLQSNINDTQKSQHGAPPVSCLFRRDAGITDVKSKMLWAAGESGGVKMKYLYLSD